MSYRTVQDPVNYTTGVVRATGSGPLGSAKAAALRNLALAIRTIPVTATTTVKSYAMESGTVETKLAALLQNARTVAETVGKEGITTITVEIPLYGARSVAAAVLAEVILDPRDLHANAPIPRPEARPAPRPLPHKRPLPLTPPRDRGPFTALLVDCRGLGVQAALSPKLYDSSGHELYGPLRVDIDDAIIGGIVGYPRSVEEALKSKRAGARPLIVQALGPKGSSKVDMVLSNDDALRVIQADQQAGFLAQCRVLLLCDPPR
ncbi:hypothetical protein [Armatimonas rosea]|uniref:Uncharacterized protein n=1 Tax=Armatimonas rosea TaxID=685828 RepID=A0A7W9SVB6_ARMRO|nr:hypothetical protein [Armatimonas rosea]MBB6052693.1 hypothetical protein [Armatimonas rosea]